MHLGAGVAVNREPPVADGEGKDVDGIVRLERDGAQRVVEGGLGVAFLFLRAALLLDEVGILAGDLLEDESIFRFRAQGGVVELQRRARVLPGLGRGGAGQQVIGGTGREGADAAGEQEGGEKAGHC